MLRKLSKVAFYFALFVSVVLVLMVVFSPYSRQGDQRMIAYSLVIDAPTELVFDYLGNSENASDWSVFVDHISTLNGGEIPDGSVGSIRRCFVHADESGTQWDEEIVVLIPYEKRRLTIFNMQDFPMTAAHLVTEQLYRKITDDQCELTFTVFYDQEHPGLLSHLKLYFAAYRMQRIFKQNMENIKRNVEELTQ